MPGSAGHRAGLAETLTGRKVTFTGDTITLEPGTETSSEASTGTTGDEAATSHPDG